MLGRVDAVQAIAGPKTNRKGSRRTGGKSELQRAQCRVTPGGGNAKESATENKTARPRPKKRRRGKGETAG